MSLSLCVRNIIFLRCLSQCR